MLVAGLFVVDSVSPASAAPVWTRSDTSGALAWTSITSNSDGSKLAAVETNGFVWTSTDYGSTWTKRTTVKRAWASITSSSDGSKLAAVATLGTVFTSSDYGITWISRSAAAGDRAWTSIASSSDGTRLVAIVLSTLVVPGNIWTSSDSGVSWTRRTDAGDRVWTSVASSSDGTRLAAVEGLGNIWTSSDSGENWTRQNDAGSRAWISIASSSDGTKLAAAASVGDIWTSNDSGENWVRRSDAGNRVWKSVASSSDGSRLAAVVSGTGDIWSSSNFGATWVRQTGAGARAWTSIASSSDGSRLAALGAGVRVWTTVLPTVHFNTNGHGQQPADEIGVSSIAVADLPVLSTAGYTFLGWSATINGPVTTSDHAPDSDSTLFAQWSANDLTVIFDSQGGSTVADGATKTGENVDDPGEPIRPGYTFDGWFTAPTGGVEVDLDDAHGRTSDFTLFAQWSANDLTVVFDSQGGSSIADGETFTGESVDDPGRPTRAGYTFGGWFTAPTGGEEVEFPFVHGQTEDFTLFARWEVNVLAMTGVSGSSLSMIALGACGMIGVSVLLRRRKATEIHSEI